jgi:hypothetical protein
VVGVNPGGDVLSRGAPRIFAEFGGVLWNGDRVKVDNTKHRVVSRLHVAPLHKRTGVIPEVQRFSAGLHPRKQSWSGHVRPSMS